MASQHDDMFYETMNRSPTNPRGYSTMGLNRQTSRPYEAYGQQSNMYAADDYATARYDTARADRSVPPIFNSNYPGYDSQTWNYNATTANAGTIGATSRSRSTARRQPLPNAWVDPSYPPMPTQGLNGLSNGHMSTPYSQSSQGRSDRASSDQDDELIPTAIVIKNIPFAIKREQLTEVMSDLHLPLPYAFNYHFDNGVFRGLAFANFSTPEETAAVIEAMNHMDLQGRKLRVEYKKMLPLQERERIEREKRERRGQLEEQHRPIQNLSLQTQHSASSLSSAHPAASPSPVSMRSGNPNNQGDGSKLDMNDATTLDFYAKLVVFKDDETRRVFVIDPPLSSHYRRIIHELAHKLGLEHESAGQGEARHVQIYKDKVARGVQPQSLLYNDPSRRGLARAATMDLNEGREPVYPGLRTHNSALLEIPGSPGLNGGVNGQRSLREAKSFGDLQNRTSSPALSSSSFPAGLSQNVSRYNEYGTINGGANPPNLTSQTGLGLSSRDDPSFLSGSFANMSVGYERSRINGRLINGEGTNMAGPIGSQRGLNGLGSLTNNYDDQTRNNSSSAVPERQPRGPGSEWGAGFGRPRQRGSGELDVNEPDQGSDRNGQNNSRYM